jgi:hypothetical protein
MAESQLLLNTNYVELWGWRPLHKAARIADSATIYSSEISLSSSKYFLYVLLSEQLSFRLFYIWVNRL